MTAFRTAGMGTAAVIERVATQVGHEMATVLTDAVVAARVGKDYGAGVVEAPVAIVGAAAAAAAAAAALDINATAVGLWNKGSMKAQDGKRSLTWTLLSEKGSSMQLSWNPVGMLRKREPGPSAATTLPTNSAGLC